MHKLKTFDETLQEALNSEFNTQLTKKNDFLCDSDGNKKYKVLKIDQFNLVKGDVVYDEKQDSIYKIVSWYIGTDKKGKANSFKELLSKHNVKSNSSVESSIDALLKATNQHIGTLKLAIKINELNSYIQYDVQKKYFMTLSGKKIDLVKIESV